MTVWITFSWKVKPCSLVETYVRFWGTYCLHSL